MEAQVDVDHDNRSVEIHDLREAILKHVDAKYRVTADDMAYNFGTLSCEAIGSALAIDLRERLGIKGVITVRVWEDTPGMGAVVSDVPVPKR